MSTRAFPATRRPRAQRGLSLVELMVAMTIGLLIMVVIANLFIGTKASFRAQDDASRVQENLRFAAQVMARTLRLAGYRADWNQSYEQVFGTGVTPIAGTDNDGANSSDTVIARFQGSGTGTSLANCVPSNSCGGADGTILDCLGNRIDRQMGTTKFVENRFRVRTPGANGGPALFCSIDGGTTWTEIVPDIESMQVLYGEKTSALPNAERYLVAGAAGQNMNNVISVRVALLHRSPSESAGLVDTKTYDLARTTYNPADDRRFRLAATTTVGLRNRTQ